MLNSWWCGPVAIFPGCASSETDEMHGDLAVEVQKASDPGNGR